MKSLLLIAFSCFLFVSCSDTQADAQRKVDSFNYNTVTLEGCDYYFIPNTDGSIITHKGNCRNPIHKQISHDTIKIYLHG